MIEFAIGFVSHWFFAKVKTRYDELKIEDKQLEVIEEIKDDGFILQDRELWMNNPAELLEFVYKDLAIEGKITKRTRQEIFNYFEEQKVKNK